MPIIVTRASKDPQNTIDTFTELTDAPDSYSGEQNKYVRVNPTADGLIFDTVSGGEGTDHSVLANLDYASAGHTGFASSTQLLTTSGDIIAQFPADFYSRAEITTISGDIVDQIPNLSGYTTEVYVTTVSGDIVSQIPDVVDFITDAEVATISGDIIVQMPTDFYTQAEVTTISGDIVLQIPSLSGYATEALVTTVSGDLFDQIPTDFYTTGEVDSLITSVSGTTDHSLLDNLAYASAGHIGFVSSDDLTTVSGLYQAHADDSTIHRIINDSGSSATELWSASRINSELSGKENSFSEIDGGTFV